MVVWFARARLFCGFEILRFVGPISLESMRGEVISDTLFGVMVFLPERDAYTSLSGGDGRFVDIHEDFNSFRFFIIIIEIC